MNRAFTRQDATLGPFSVPLPNGAADVALTPFETGTSSYSRLMAPCEFELTAPALSVTELPNGQRMVYRLEDAAFADFSDAQILIPELVVQIGADGVGAAGIVRRFRPRSDVRRYFRIRIFKSGSGDASGKSAVMNVYF